MGFLSNTPENRKSVNKNPKSYFTKSLQNAKAQIILSEDCSNSVLQTGREGTWLFEESGLLGSIPGGEAGGTHWNPRRDLVPKEADTSESSRFCQTHRWGGAWAHMGDQLLPSRRETVSGSGGPR